MQQMQAEKDLFERMKGLVPKYVEGDKTRVLEGSQYITGLSDRVAQSFAGGKVSEAMRDLRQAKGGVEQMWNPGGLFHSVQSFYDQYTKARADVNDFTKSFKSPVYKTVYMDQVEKAAKEGSQYDPDTRTFKSMGAPDMMAEYLLADEFDKFLKDWKSDQSVQIYNRGDGYYYVGTTERVKEEDLANAFKGFLKRPEAVYALDMEARYRMLSSPPGTAEALRQNRLSQTDLAAQYGKAKIEQIGKILKEGKVEQIKEIQKLLGVDADGKVGPKTNAAYEAYKAQAEAELEENVTSQTIDAANADDLQLFRQTTIEGIIGSVVPKHALIKQNGRLVIDWKAQERVRAANMKALFDGMTPFFSPVSVIPGGTVQNPVEGLAKSFQSQEKEFGNLLRGHAEANPTLAAAAKAANMDFYKFHTVLAEAMAAGWRASKNNGVEWNAFHNYLKENGVPNTKTSNHGELWKNFAQNETVRMEVYNRQGQLDSAREPLSVTESVLNSALSTIPDSKIDWSAVSTALGGRTVTTGSGASQRTYGTTPQDAKALYEKGDPKAVRAVQDWMIKQVKGDTFRDVLGVVPVNQIIGGSTDAYAKSLLRGIQGSRIANWVDWNVISDKDREKLGLNKKGEFVQGEKGEKKGLKDLHFGYVFTANGSKDLYMTAVTNDNQAVHIPLKALDKSLQRTAILAFTSDGVNPKDPTGTLSSPIFQTGAALLFDHDQATPRILQTAHVLPLFNKGKLGDIGTVTISPPGKNSFDLHTYLQRDGDSTYFIASRTELTDEQRKNLSRLGDGTYKHKIQSISDVDKALTATKSFFYLGQAFEEAAKVEKNYTVDPFMQQEARSRVLPFIQAQY